MAIRPCVIRTSILLGKVNLTHMMRKWRSSELQLGNRPCAFFVLGQTTCPVPSAELPLLFEPCPHAHGTQVEGLWISRAEEIEISVLRCHSPRMKLLASSTCGHRETEFQKCFTRNPGVFPQLQGPAVCQKNALALSRAVPPLLRAAFNPVLCCLASCIVTIRHCHDGVDAFDGTPINLLRGILLAVLPHGLGHPMYGPRRLEDKLRNLFYGLPYPFHPHRPNERVVPKVWQEFWTELVLPIVPKLQVTNGRSCPNSLWSKMNKNHEVSRTAWGQELLQRAAAEAHVHLNLDRELAEKHAPVHAAVSTCTHV